MPAPTTRIATLVVAAAAASSAPVAGAGCGEPAPAVRLVPVDRACGRVADARALLVTPLGALTADRQLVQAGAPVTLATLPAATRQLAVEVVGEGGVVGAIGKTAPFELDALADGDVLTVAMGAPDGACPAGALVEPRTDALIARAGAQVLIVGGRGATGPLATAELYDPATETSRPVAVPPGLAGGALGLTGAALAELPDGRVALVGGPQPGLAVFDPATASFAAPRLTGVARAHHAAIALDARRVLVAGGCAMLMADGGCAPGSGAPATLVIDVEDGHVGTGAALLAARVDPTIVVEPGRDGRRRLVIVGGRDLDGAPITSGQRIDPDSGAVDLIAGLGDAAAVLDSGAILTAFAPAGAPPRAAGAIVVPGLTAARALDGTPARAGARLVTLEDGEVLALGGGPTLRYQPASGTWRALAADGLAIERGAAAVRLAEGTVLVAGGERAGVPVTDVVRVRPRLLGPYASAVSVVPGALDSDPALTPLDPARATAVPRWQVSVGAWAIVGGPVGDDLRLSWTGELPADGASLLFGFVDAGHHARADLVPGRPVALVTVDGGEDTVRCEGAPAPAAGPIVARVEVTAGAAQVLAGGRVLVRCPVSGQPGGRVGVGARGAGAVTIETLAVTR